MFKIYLMNLKTNEIFTKIINNFNDKQNFIRKCKYSKKVMVLSVIPIEF